MSGEIKPVLTEKDIREVLKTLAGQVQQCEQDEGSFLLVGIHTRGIPLAKRLAKLMHREEQPIGTLDIALYRDDLSTIADMPLVRQTDLPFDVQGKNLLLIDDVLFTGRTIRAALDAVMDLGRPKKISLLALIDRGGRELPIQADFVGTKIPVGSDEVVEVHLKEVEGHDQVIVTKKEIRK